MYSVKVEEVHSGDDMVLMVDLAIDSLYKKVRARLYGVDTPDAYCMGPDTDAGKVRDTVRDLTRSGECFVKLHSCNSRGGWKVTLIVKNDEGETNVNELLRNSGFVFKGQNHG